MIRTNNATKRTAHVFSWVLSLCLSLAICVSCIATAVAEENTFEQTLVIEQTVEGNANRTKYTYVLAPKKDDNPMPENGPGVYDKEKNTYTFTLDGNDSHKTTLTFPSDKPVNYQYELTRVEEVPAGDTVKPETHLFGYLVEQDKTTGNMVIIPYTCYDSKMEIWNKVDDDGNPIGMTLYNDIVGTKGDKGDPGDPGKDGQDGKDGADGQKGSDGKNGTNGTNGTNGKNGTNGTNGTSTVKTITQTVGKAINTGDPNHILLWGGLAVLSASALVAILILRRKKEKDEQNS